MNRRQLLVQAGALTAAVGAGALLAGSSSVGATPTSGDRLGFLHPEWLISASELEELLAEPQVRVLALQKNDEFEAAHITGALLVEYGRIDLDDTSEVSIQTWRASIGALLSELGVSPADTVVVYDGGSGHAPRLWWLLDQVGHRDKRVLNGGLPAWLEEVGTVASGTTSNAPSGTTYPIVANETAVATIDEVIAAFDDGSALFVDARYGEDYVEGHIPGAISIPLESNVTSESPHYFRSVDELEAVYSVIRKDALVIPYCAGGVRSAGTYFVLRQLGYERVSLFTGSWNEWSANPELPVAIGNEP